MIRPASHLRTSETRGGGLAGSAAADTTLEALSNSTDISPTPRRAPPGTRRCAMSSELGLRPRSRCPADPILSDRWWRDFGQVPGGRRLWCRLVVVFTFVCLSGVGFIFLGSAFVQQAYQTYQERHLSLPLIWCIIAMVSGMLMLLGGFVLGRFLISEKWRKNERPTYPSMAPCPPPRVRYTTNNNDSELDAQVQIDLPPPYDASNLPPIFIVTRRNIAVTLPVPSVGVLKPPSYADTIGSPPKYTEIDDVTCQRSEHACEEATSSQDAATSQMLTTQPVTSNVRSSRIEVITVVSTRENPPPYDADCSSRVALLGGTVAAAGGESS